MNSKMHSWICMSVATLLIFVDVRTGALTQNVELPRRCYHCSSGVNITSTCDRPIILLCPKERPYCATTATLPNFTSSLTCVEVLGACSLSSRPLALELTCACSSPLCNAPFSRDLQNQLLNYTAQIKNKNGTDIAQFLQIYKARFVNMTDDEIYKQITVQEATKRYDVSVSTTSTVKPVHLNLDHPRAEALKHDGTAPTDDDEDDGEGSGSYEDPRSRRPVSAPAAPSSYLPAGENKAPPLYITSCLLILTVVHLIV